ncbi:MAG: hypothetical protein U7123_01770 [Potamolinea sp.]
MRKVAALGRFYWCEEKAIAQRAVPKAIALGIFFSKLFATQKQ